VRSLFLSLADAQHKEEPKRRKSTRTTLACISQLCAAVVDFCSLSAFDAFIWYSLHSVAFHLFHTFVGGYIYSPSSLLVHISADCQALLIFICQYSYIGKEYDTELINVSLFETVCVCILPPLLPLLLCLPRLLYNALAAWLETLCRWELPLSFDLSPSFALALSELRLTRPDGFPKTLASHSIQMCL
jgi:hypothetical protein